MEINVFESDSQEMDAWKNANAAWIEGDEQSAEKFLKEQEKYVEQRSEIQAELQKCAEELSATLEGS